MTFVDDFSREGSCLCWSVREKYLGRTEHDSALMILMGAALFAISISSEDWHCTRRLMLYMHSRLVQSVLESWRPAVSILHAVLAPALYVQSVLQVAWKKTADRAPGEGFAICAGSVSDCSLMLYSSPHMLYS